MSARAQRSTRQPRAARARARGVNALVRAVKEAGTASFRRERREIPASLRLAAGTRSCRARALRTFRSSPPPPDVVASTGLARDDGKRRARSP